MKKVVWALIDSRKGSAGQIRGVVQQLDAAKFAVIEKNIEYTALSALPNFLRGASLLGLASSSVPEINRDFPDVVISGSRRSAPVARWIKKHSGGKTKIVQILYPGAFGRKDYDLIFVPEHDRGKISGDNVRFTIGSPHRVTPQSLAAARLEWEKAFVALPRPLTALIIGGNIKGKGFTEENAKTLAQAVKEYHNKTGGSLLVTDSWRTGENMEKLILNILKGIPSYNYLWGDKSSNPFMGYLACADNIIATGDSVSMCCEACGTGKPVFIFTGKGWLTPKHLRFVDSLTSGGYAAVLSQDNLSFVPAASLNPAAEIAAEITALFKI